jgi:hypothetical protein
MTWKKENTQAPREFFLIFTGDEREFVKQESQGNV